MRPFPLGLSGFARAELRNPCVRSFVPYLVQGVKHGFQDIGARNVEALRKQREESECPGLVCRSVVGSAG